jgi:hypothetical protein
VLDIIPIGDAFKRADMAQPFDLPERLIACDPGIDTQPDGADRGRPSTLAEFRSCFLPA